MLDRIAKNSANKNKILFLHKNSNKNKEEEEEKMEETGVKKVIIKPITEIAKKIGIEEDQLIPYGKYMAKIPHQVLKTIKNKTDGKLIIVTAITPTPAGEGKTTTFTMETHSTLMCAM